MLRDRVQDDYFEWLFSFVCEERKSGKISFRKLLKLLHDIDFEYIIPKDANRAEDGMSLRYRFAYDYAGIEDAERYLDGPCSVLEMMVALAIRCEEDIMDDTRYGDRTAQWFWGMVVSLGLGAMVDDRYDEQLIRDVVDQFLDRDYARNGKGGLFTIRGCPRDLRRVEIWTQMLWYLDRII